jgi:hypothetical protein
MQAKQRLGDESKMFRSLVDSAFGARVPQMRRYTPLFRTLKCRTP